MAVNLTPQYHKAEAEYRRAQTPEDRVACLEEMLRLMPKHKASEHLQAELKTRLKDAKSEVEAEKRAPKAGRTYRIPRQGAGTILLIGSPNAGKSRVLKELTNAEPVVADYPFTTHETMPGMMAWEDVNVQLIDTPPLSAAHLEPYVLNMVRSADAVGLCFNGSSDDAPEETAEVYSELAKRKTQLAAESGFADEDFSIIKVRTVLIVTRADDPGCDIRLELLRELMEIPFPIQKVEFDRAESREALRNCLYDALGLIRIYTKAPGKPADKKDPFTIPKGGTVEDLAAKVHRDLVESLKFAKIWGESARDGQSVGREHILADRDLVELHS